MTGSQLGFARCLAFAAALGCSAPRAREVLVSNTGEATSASEDDAIVAAVLERFVADPNTLADVGLLPKEGSIYVMTEVGSKPDPIVRIGSLPSGPRRYVGKTLAELQAEADQKNLDIDFIRFFSITIQGPRASVTSGVDVVFPTQRNAGKLCCCEAQDRYENRDGRWTFVSRDREICS